MPFEVRTKTAADSCSRRSQIPLAARLRGPGMSIALAETAPQSAPTATGRGGPWSFHEVQMNPSILPPVATEQAAVGRIPVTVLTGFLGSGKTTLLNHLVKLPEMAGTAVLINEFGEIGIDHHLIDKIDDELLLLDSGCVCCSVRGDLVKALELLSERMARREIAPLTRIVIETSGLADPVPVIQTLMEQRFVAARYFCEGVVTVVDATRAARQLVVHREAVRQVALADRILVSKSDLSSAISLAALKSQLHEINPTAPLMEIRMGRIEGARFFGGGIYSTAGTRADPASWIGLSADADSGQGPALLSGMQPSPLAIGIRGSATHDRRNTSFTVSFEAPVSWYGFSAAMARILLEYGPQLLRVKGLVNAVGESRPLVVHCVQDVAYPAVLLERWPRTGAFADRRGRIVFIVRDMDPEQQMAIREALRRLPSDSLALRGSAANPSWPTRCWMAQRLSVGASDLGHEGWVVYRRRVRVGNN